MSGSMRGVGAITKQEIFNTVGFLEKELGLSLKDNMLGSAGKKNISGDIDIAFDTSKMSLEELHARLSQIPIVKDIEKALVLKCSMEIVGYDPSVKTNRPRTGLVQVDFMISDDPEYAKVFYHSPGEGESEYKGGHRNALLSTLVVNKDLKNSKEKTEDGRSITQEKYKLSPTEGLTRVRRTLVKGKNGKYLKKYNEERIAGPWKKKDDIVKILGLDSPDDLNSYESLRDAIKRNFSREFFEDVMEKFRNHSFFKYGNIAPVKESYQLNEGARIQHVEDLIFWGGSAGAQKAIRILNNASQNLTLKWDGTPAVFFSKEQNEPLMLTDKRGYLAKKVDGKTKSKKDLVAHLKARKYSDTPMYKKHISNMGRLYTLLDAALKETNGVIKGDVLFTERPPVNSEGNYVFTPNAVTYTVDAQSELGKKIEKAEVCIALHTQDIPKSNLPQLLLLPPVSPVDITTDTRKINALIKKVNKFGSSVDAILDQETLRANKISDLPQLMYRYVNGRVEKSYRTIGRDFVEFIQTFDKLTDAKRGRILSHIEQNLQSFNNLWQLYRSVIALKKEVIHSAENSGHGVRSSINGIPGGEGWVSSGDDGSAKLVDREFFTRANNQLNREEFEPISYQELTEKLSFMGRKKLARSMKRNKTKLKVARKKASNKTANAETILKRASKRARAEVADHLLRGRKKQSLSAAQKSKLEDRVKAKSNQVNALTRKLKPTVRRDDRK